MLGLRVRIRDAVYPDQKPCRPFSARIKSAISDTLGEVVVGEEERAESREYVCLRVTILEIGVVKNLEQAPARVPTANSSNMGRVVALAPCV